MRTILQLQLKLQLLFILQIQNTLQLKYNNYFIFTILHTTDMTIHIANNNCITIRYNILIIYHIQLLFHFNEITTTSSKD